MGVSFFSMKRFSTGEGLSAKSWAFRLEWNPAGRKGGAEVETCGSRESFEAHGLSLKTFSDSRVRIKTGRAAGKTLLPAFLLSVLSASPSVALDAAVPPSLRVPPGFRVQLFASGLDRARGLALSPEGVLHVCEMEAGRLTALPDTDGDGTADQKRIVVEGLRKAHSAAFHGGKLYVAETHRVAVYPRVSRPLTAAEGKTLLPLPPDGNHFTRTVAFSPQGRMFVSVGSTCNVCVEKDPRRAAILAADPDGSRMEIFASGLRNAVGMAFHPQTGALWVSHNGRDFLGDDLPPETFFTVERGKHYGWPYAFFVDGRVVRDPDFGHLAGRPTDRPVFEYQAHTAPLGVCFYTGKAFPERYHGGFFVALHGSWNRSVPVGYKVIFTPVEGPERVGKPEDFLWGFLRGRTRHGRPVDVLTGPRGELFVSDDHQGRIYRVVYDPFSE